MKSIELNVSATRQSDQPNHSTATGSVVTEMTRLVRTIIQEQRKLDREVIKVQLSGVGKESF